MFFAYDKPYNYGVDLCSFIDVLRKEEVYAEYLQITTLCRSLTGVECKLLTITSNIDLNLTYYEFLKIGQRSNQA
jgi:hypothetical protein